MLYSLDFEDMAKLEASLSDLGFRIAQRDSGEVKSGDNYKARVLTVEKVGMSKLEKDASNTKLQKLSSGLKIVKVEERVKDTRKIVDEFWIKGQQRVKARLTAQDQEVLTEETDILSRMKALQKDHRTIKDIPAEQVVLNGFSRIFNGQKHVLFARLTSAIGSVMLR